MTSLNSVQRTYCTLCQQSRSGYKSEPAPPHKGTAHTTKIFKGKKGLPSGHFKTHQKSMPTRTWSWSQPSCWGSWRALRLPPKVRGSHARPLWVQGWRWTQSLVWLAQGLRFLGFSLRSLQGTILSFLLILLQAILVLQFGFHPPAGKS